MIDLWRCWENVVLGVRTAADWTPHLERPHYCRSCPLPLEAHPLVDGAHRWLASVPDSTDQPVEVTDWSYLSYHLATMGIPSMIDEDVATNPEDDPWMPADGADCVLVWLTKEDAGRLAALVAARRVGGSGG